MMKLFTLFLLLICVLTAVGQDNQKANSRSLLSAGKPYNAESNIVLLENLVSIMRGEPNPNGVIILIARLGKGETRRELNRRRLFNVSEFYSAISRIPAEKIIVAEGHRVSNYGRIEIYWNGILREILPVYRNTDLLVDCCEMSTRFYPYKDVAERKAKQNRKRG